MIHISNIIYLTNDKTLSGPSIEYGGITYRKYGELNGKIINLFRKSYYIRGHQNGLEYYPQTIKYHFVINYFLNSMIHGIAAHKMGSRYYFSTSEDEIYN